jgi:predicted nucleic acid-binding protein
MILVDTSVWIEHLRRGEARLVAALSDGLVRIHPCIIGEIALGSLRQRELILGALNAIPPVTVATDGEVHALVEVEHLFGLGIGFVDVHLLAALRLTPGVRLWTLDKRLAAVADRLGVGAPSAN